MEKRLSDGYTAESRPGRYKGRPGNVTWASFKPHSRHSSAVSPLRLNSSGVIQSGKADCVLLDINFARRCAGNVLSSRRDLLPASFLPDPSSLSESRSFVTDPIQFDVRISRRRVSRELERASNKVRLFFPSSILCVSRTAKLSFRYFSTRNKPRKLFRLACRERKRDRDREKRKRARKTEISCRYEIIFQSPTT